MTNVLPFQFSLDTFAGTSAHQAFIDYKRGPISREAAGDRFGRKKLQRSVLVDESLPVYPAFRSLLQGDHLGVEFALFAHADLLAEEGLLHDHSRILGGRPFPCGDFYEGLVIDDYFAIGVESRSTDLALSQASLAFDTAIAAYTKEEVLGSPEKDIKGSTHFKVVGAEVNSSEQALSRSLVSVGAPAEKRIALAVLSLRVAAMPVISSALAARLAGNWTSVLMYRRCLTCLLKDIYQFGTSKPKFSKAEVYTLPRKVADELVICSALAWVASANVTLPYLPQVFATDASLHKGAVTSREIHPDAADWLWLGGDKKGGYTMLEEHHRELLIAIGQPPECQDSVEATAPENALNFYFDFIEVCGGSAGVSKALAKKGYVVAPPLDISDLLHFDICNLRLLDWILYMITQRRLRAVMVEPVCTTFSPAAHPAVWSYKVPLGYDRKCPKTLRGNIIAFRCLVIAWYCSTVSAPVLLEQPRLSKMAWLSAWRFLLSCKGFSEAVVASCQFGFPHRKEFRLLGHGIDMSSLDRRCGGGHRHVFIAGKLTKASAEYTPLLAEHFAEHFHKALQGTARAEAESVKVTGIESVIANDILSTGTWTVEAAWRWSFPARINILESCAFVTLLKMLAIRGGGCRFTALLDSRVAKGAISKGRPSAYALSPSLRRAAAIQVAFGLYPSLGFAPTRLNVADDPTRDHSLREPCRHSLLEL